MSFEDLLGFFLLEDFRKVLVLAGVVIGGESTGDRLDPLVMCGVSGMAGGEGGKVGGALFTLSGVDLSLKASSMGKDMGEAILGLSCRTDSASSTLDFQEF